jgi:hypothetical protein
MHWSPALPGVPHPFEPCLYGAGMPHNFPKTGIYLLLHFVTRSYGCERILFVFTFSFLPASAGLPILMSLVYMELARRVGFPMIGVNLPLHFVIRPMTMESEFLVDPHEGGKVRS